MGTRTIKPAPHAETAGIDTADTQEPDPLLQSAGHYRDDPFWDEMLASIRRHRREMDAEWDATE